MSCTHRRFTVLLALGLFALVSPAAVAQKPDPKKKSKPKPIKLKNKTESADEKKEDPTKDGEGAKTPTGSSDAKDGKGAKSKRRLSPAERKAAAAEKKRQRVEEREKGRRAREALRALEKAHGATVERVKALEGTLAEQSKHSHDPPPDPGTSLLTILALILALLALGVGLLALLKTRTPTPDEEHYNGAADLQAKVADQSEQIKALRVRLATLDGPADTTDESAELQSRATKRLTAAQERFREQRAEVFAQTTSTLGQALELFRTLQRRRLLPTLDSYHVPQVLGDHAGLLHARLSAVPVEPGAQSRSIGTAIDYAIRCALYERELDAVLARERAQLSRPFHPDGSALLNFLGEAIAVLDPQGTADLEDWEVNDELKGLVTFAKGCGYELIYPRRGTPMSQHEHEMAAAESAPGVREMAVVRVKRFGYRAGGRVERKAQVVVAQ